MTQKDTIFSFDLVEELAQSVFDESQGEASADMTFNDGFITLTVCKIQTCEIQVYHVKETPELYAEMDKNYVTLVETVSSGDDFWDKWSSAIDVLSNHKLVDTVLNP